MTSSSNPISVNMVIPPVLDPGFLPASLYNREFRTLAARTSSTPLRLALERADGSVSVYETVVLAPGSAHFDLNLRYVERIVKFLLWQRGGWRLHVGGPRKIGEYLRRVYAKGGARQFDADFMGSVHGQTFTVVTADPENVPAAKETSRPLGRHLDGCRVGFDLGASDRKASAVIDGEAVFSEEVVWDPRNQSDPNYHYEGILDSIRRAAAKLPRLDAVGGSAAGIYINNRARVASLYRGVSQQDFDAHIAGVFLRIRDELGVPLDVVNDGDVTALAGSMSIGENPVLGVAFGSSLAAGYVDGSGNITGWLNELAFVPVDYREKGPVDDWSGDAGCGVQYFSQVGANRIASAAGMEFPAGLTLPEKLVVLQEKMKSGDPLAPKVYETIGSCLGYAVAHYADFYELKHILALGRVTTGEGGEILLRVANQVLKAEFPELAKKITLALPDEKSRRVGQSIAAASLPSLAKVGT